MTRIAFVDAHLLGEISSQMQPPGQAATKLPDICSLNAWLAARGVAIRLPIQPTENMLSIPATESENENDRDRRSRRLLRSAQLELIVTDNIAAPLSRYERCLLRAAANANGRLPIRRLRRKLASCVRDSFPFKKVKRQGKLLGAQLTGVRI